MSLLEEEPLPGPVVPEEDDRDNAEEQDKEEGDVHAVH